MPSNKHAPPRKFPWPPFKPRHPAPRGRRGYVNLTDPWDGFLYFRLFAIGSLFFGIAFAVLRFPFFCSIPFLITGCVFLAITLYAYCAHREQRRLEQEEKQRRAEKQKAWRERRKQQRIGH